MPDQLDGVLSGRARLRAASRCARGGSIAPLWRRPGAPHHGSSRPGAARHRCAGGPHGDRCGAGRPGPIRAPALRPVSGGRGLDRRAAAAGVFCRRQKHAGRLRRLHPRNEYPGGGTAARRATGAAALADGVQDHERAARLRHGDPGRLSQPGAPEPAGRHGYQCHQCRRVPELAPVRPGGRLRLPARRQAGDLGKGSVGHAWLPVVRRSGRVRGPDLGRPLENDGFRAHRTSHGGAVLSASPVSESGGIAIARVGDRVSCPRPGHVNCVIVSGDATMIVDGQPVARHGDKQANASYGAGHASLVDPHPDRRRGICGLLAGRRVVLARHAPHAGRGRPAHLPAAAAADAVAAGLAGRVDRAQADGRRRGGRHRRQRRCSARRVPGPRPCCSAAIDGDRCRVALAARRHGRAASGRHPGPPHVAGARSRAAERRRLPGPDRPHRRRRQRHAGRRHDGLAGAPPPGRQLDRRTVARHRARQRDRRQPGPGAGRTSGAAAVSGRCRRRQAAAAVADAARGGAAAAGMGCTGTPGSPRLAAPAGRAHRLARRPHRPRAGAHAGRYRPASAAADRATGAPGRHCGTAAAVPAGGMPLAHRPGQRAGLGRPLHPARQRAPERPHSRRRRRRPAAGRPGASSTVRPRGRPPAAPGQQRAARQRFRHPPARGRPPAGGNGQPGAGRRRRRSRCRERADVRQRSARRQHDRGDGHGLGVAARARSRQPGAERDGRLWRRRRGVHRGGAGAGCAAGGSRRGTGAVRDQSRSFPPGCGAVDRPAWQ
uniref:Uncharacterized protein n=1 Tax=Tanacetum cinerariifolium TaxID=118510 RepID=A0A6L2N212_TANCI|nr:hypothetical protein [Tanacetum cinerariifolium]